jgi:hypothetical protein
LTLELRVKYEIFSEKLSLLIPHPYLKEKIILNKNYIKGSRMTPEDIYLMPQAEFQISWQ